MPSIFQSNLSVVGTARSSSPPFTLPRTNSVISSSSAQAGGEEGGDNGGSAGTDMAGSDVPEPALTPRSSLEDPDNG